MLALGAVAALLAGCATATPAGPTAAEFSALMPGQVVRGVDCAFIPEEGSEWACRYQRRTAAGDWESRDAFVAVDGGRWVLIDG